MEIRQYSETDEALCDNARVCIQHLGRSHVMSISEIGCCGAYCSTCSEFKEQACKGCKVGYESANRDILKAKCKMKVCCISKKLQSCADCSEYSTCSVLNDFYLAGVHILDSEFYYPLLRGLCD